MRTDNKRIDINVEIKKDIHDSINEILNSSSHEECGIFLGDKKVDSFVIKDLIHDRKVGDKTRYSSIRRTKNIYPSYLTKIHKTCDYLGEWHTHPLGDSSPSKNDHRVMVSLLGDPLYNSPESLLLGICSKEDGLLLFLFMLLAKPIEINYSIIG